MTHRNCSSSLQLFLLLLVFFGISFPSQFYTHKKVFKNQCHDNPMDLGQLCNDDTIKYHQQNDNLFGFLLFHNWIIISGANGQLNAFGGGTFCTDFESDCSTFRQYCFLQSIAEACMFSCGICGGFGGIGGPFGKKK